MSIGEWVEVRVGDGGWSRYTVASVSGNEFTVNVRRFRDHCLPEVYYMGGVGVNWRKV